MIGVFKKPINKEKELKKTNQEKELKKLILKLEKLLDVVRF
jgi:hypothetical protein